MSYSSRPSDFVRRSLALAAILSASMAVASAQTAPVSSEGTTQAAPIANLHIPAVNTSDDSLFSSSSDNALDANGMPVLTADALKMPPLNAQYGGRYGRPRYRGGNTNQDGSPKWAFLVGAGFTAPVTQDSNYLKTSWAFQVGGGRNFNKMLSLIAQFDWDNFGFTGQTIANQSTVYGDPSNTSGLDGNSHIWSLSLNPTINFYAHEGLGAYFVVGGGFYHKEATFFVPAAGYYCDPYSGFCYQYVANQTIQNYTSNSPGASGGIGITYKPSRFSGERLYAEARIVHTFNTYKPGIDVNTPTNVSNGYTGWNFFPANSQETTYFPVKVGIRF